MTCLVFCFSRELYTIFPAKHIHLLILLQDAHQVSIYRLECLWHELTRHRVRTLTGKEIELDIESDYKVSRIKERVEETEGIPPVQQRLIYGGKQM